MLFSLSAQNFRTLTEKERTILLRKADDFKTFLNCSDILMLLLSKDVINHEELLEIRAKKVIYKQNEALFHLIVNKKPDQVMTFRQVLLDTGREPLARFIDFPADVEPQDSVSTSSLPPCQEEGGTNVFNEPHPYGGDVAQQFSALRLDGATVVQAVSDVVDGNRKCGVIPAKPVARVGPAVKPGAKKSKETDMDNKKLKT